MQIDETVHGCPVAVVHRIVRVEILALQVKSGPPRGNRLWLRPQAALWIANSAKDRWMSKAITRIDKASRLSKGDAAGECYSDGRQHHHHSSFPLRHTPLRTRRGQSRDHAKA